VKDTDEPAATETVPVPVPFSPPTLHLRSLEVRSEGVSFELRKVIQIFLTGHGRIIVSVLSDIGVGRVLDTVGGEGLEDICE